MAGLTSLVGAVAVGVEHLPTMSALQLSAMNGWPLSFLSLSHSIFAVVPARRSFQHTYVQHGIDIFPIDIYKK